MSDISRRVSGVLLRKVVEMAKRVATCVACVAALIAALVAGASPAPAAEDFQITLPAGTACPGFAVSIAGSGGNSSVNTVGNGRTITTGTGSGLVFTNLVTQDTFSLKSNGAPGQSMTDGESQIVTSEGHHVIILFATDTPPGPSTTLVVGRLVYTVDAAGNFVVQSVHGKTTDICAELS
jgi:hypothetical protein